MDQLVPYLKQRSRNYTCGISEKILNQLSGHDALFKNISPEFKNLFESTIYQSFCGLNCLDLSQGGDGMIVPTFVEFMEDWIFWVQDGDFKSLISDADKQIYSKYLWTLELKTELSSTYLSKEINKLLAS